MLSTALRTPFIDPNIFFAQIGSEVIDPVSRLLPDEKVILKGGESLKWKEEYSRGRIAGREALGYAGASVGSAILRGQSGEPLFPEGYVGSISHSLGIGVLHFIRVSGLISKISRKKDRLEYLRKSLRRVSKLGFLKFKMSRKF
jgi:4'-phosphopantetheinyl transferase EntD